MKATLSDLSRKPFVSVLMPVRDVEPFIREAIESVRRQTYRHWQLIVIDDGSTDGTTAIVARYARKDKRISLVVNTRRRGVAGSLNLALKMVTGEYVARMDGDDVAHSRRLEKQLVLLESQKQLVAVGTQVRVIDAMGKLVGKRKFPIESKGCKELLMLTVPIQHPTLMVRAEAMKRCRYDARLCTAEDWDLYFRLLQLGELGNTKETLYDYRQVYGSNGFSNIKGAFWTILEIRNKGISRYGYRPTVLGILGTVAQLVAVLLLPDKTVFTLFNHWRVKGKRVLGLAQQIYGLAVD